MVTLLTKNPAPLDIRIHENEYQRAEPIGKYIDAEFTWKKEGVDSGKLVVEGNHRFARDLMRCSETVVPITTMVNGRRWSGRVTDFTFHGPDNSYLECELTGEQRLLHGILAYPNAYLPEWIQFPPQDIFLGGAESAMKSYTFINARRAGYPMVVAPYKFWDFKNFVAMSARMDPLDELFSQVLSQATYRASLDLWLPGDPQPFPSDYTMVRPATIFDVTEPRDMRQEIQWSVAGGGIKEYTISGRHPLGHTVLVGGKSPDIINVMIREAVNALIALALSLIGLPFLGGIGGLLDNILFAFNRFVDYTVKAQMGMYGWPEIWANAGAGAFTLDAFQAGLQALKDAAGTRGVKFTLAPDKPYEFGRGLSDNGRSRFDINDLVRFRNGDQIIEDYVSSVTVRDGRDLRRETTTVIGDDKAAQDPVARMIGAFKGLSTIVRSMNLQVN